MTKPDPFLTPPAVDPELQAIIDQAKAEIHAAFVVKSMTRKPAPPTPPVIPWTQHQFASA